MIEKTILDYLESQLTVPVLMEMPESSVDKFVVMERTGRRKEEQVYKSTFAFQSYASLLFDAASLNTLVEAAVESLITLNEISAAELNSSYNFTDTSTHRYRYQCVYEIAHYER